MQNSENLVIEIENGQIRGAVQHSIDGFDYYAFKGIPYAKPPIGSLRFKDPEPAENWSGIKDATKYGNSPCQIDPLLKTYIGSEDCLFINVFVNSMDSTNIKRPVMVWIYGGAYTFGSGNDEHYGPDYFMKKDIVLVTFNYRLGVLGFLNLDDEVATGNQALKDQVLALKWVQANIEKFGGDRNNVTVFGESSGAVCAHHIALSPMSKGLLHKIICQSGSAFNSYSLGNEPLKYVRQFCSVLGKKLYSSKEIFEFLKKVDSKDLIEAQQNMRETYEPLKYIVPFMPTVDDKSSNPIIPMSSENIGLKVIHLPFMIGYNNCEGEGFLIDILRFRVIKKEQIDAVNKNFSKAIDAPLLKIMEKYGLLIRDLRKMYFEDENISEKNALKLGHMLGDWRITYGIHNAIQMQVESSSKPIYAYKFCYNSEFTLNKSRIPYPVHGATHFDEVEFMFRNKIKEKMGFPLKNNANDYRLSQQLIEMWTNFAINGNPTPQKSELLPVEWLPVNDSTNFRYFSINTKSEMKIEEYIGKKFLTLKSSLKK